MMKEKHIYLSCNFWAQGGASVRGFVWASDVKKRKQTAEQNSLLSNSLIRTNSFSGPQEMMVLWWWK